MKRALLLSVLVVALVAPISDISAQDAPDQDRGFVVIVHVDNPSGPLEPRALSKFFLKKVKRWPNDTTVAVVDLDEDSPVREAFTRAVHDKSVSAIKSYWQRMIFSGRDVPPDELATDAEVIERVAAEVGAIGYVSSDAELGDGVKVLTVAEE